MAEEAQVEEETTQSETEWQGPKPDTPARNERVRQDQEKAEDNKRRQARQGITPVEPQQEEAPPPENPE